MNFMTNYLYINSYLLYNLELHNQDVLYYYLVRKHRCSANVFISRTEFRNVFQNNFLYPFVTMPLKNREINTSKVNKT